MTEANDQDRDDAKPAYGLRWFEGGSPDPVMFIPLDRDNLRSLRYLRILGDAEDGSESQVVDLTRWASP